MTEVIPGAVQFIQGNCLLFLCEVHQNEDLLPIQLIQSAFHLCVLDQSSTLGIHQHILQRFHTGENIAGAFIHSGPIFHIVVGVLSQGVCATNDTCPAVADILIQSGIGFSSALHGRIAGTQESNTLILSIQLAQDIDKFTNGIQRTTINTLAILVGIGVNIGVGFKEVACLSKAVCISGRNTDRVVGIFLSDILVQISQIDGRQATALRLVREHITGKVRILVCLDDLVHHSIDLRTGLFILVSITTGHTQILQYEVRLHTTRLIDHKSGFVKIIRLVLFLQSLATVPTHCTHSTGEHRLAVDNKVTVGNPGHHMFTGRQTANFTGDLLLFGGSGEDRLSLLHLGGIKGEITLRIRGNNLSFQTGSFQLQGNRLC